MMASRMSEAPMAPEPPMVSVGVKDDKPIIRASQDDYADVLMKWLKEIATQ